MKNTFGDSVAVSIFGESHGEAIGAVLDGLAPGIKVNTQNIADLLSLRRPTGVISTARQESDQFKILSGVRNGYTTGTPICIIIPNTYTHSKDYEKLNGIARPGHADYAAFCKYHGYEDRRGGGHFSGRITAALVAVGAIAIDALKNKGIEIGCHISSCAGVNDKDFNVLTDDIKTLEKLNFPVLDNKAGELMQQKILAAKEDTDSVGGIVETAVIGLPKGVGEPWFDSIESKISHAMFSIPAVKGVEFGDGFALSQKKASQVNDSFIVTNAGIKTITNSNGGINGGITNGMPVIFRCAVKPTPSISKEQNTVDFINNQNVTVSVEGRHDPCIVHRAAIVVRALTAITLCDILSFRFGTDWLGE